MGAIFGSRSGSGLDSKSDLARFDSLVARNGLDQKAEAVLCTHVREGALPSESTIHAGVMLSGTHAWLPTRTWEFDSPHPFHFAGVAQGQSATLPTWRCEFDSRPLFQFD